MGRAASVLRSNITAEIHNPRHTIYECSVPRPLKELVGFRREVVYIEAERWYDARALGQKLLSSPKIHIRRTTSELTKYMARWQIRWSGTAASFTTNPLHREIRFLCSKTRLNRHMWPFREWHEG